MECLQCGNKEFIYFYKDGEYYYCRKCIHFGRVNVGCLPIKHKYKLPTKQCEIHLTYNLTKHQKECVEQLKKLVVDQEEVFVFAACGAGKTEIVMESIKRYINEGKKVGFAISRRQVVLEICERMKDAFPMLDVIAVCEGYTSKVDGDLIICTMHQLYRYYDTFDLLIMDEIDAFPYANNEMLEKIARNACHGAFIYLSATPDKYLLRRVAKKEVHQVELFVRPHGYPLIVPKIIKLADSFQLFVLCYLLHKHKEQVLVFVPTIAKADMLEKLLYLYRARKITSKSDQKEEIMNAFKMKKFRVLICTTILERGITIEDVNVIVLNCNHSVFNEASLIQMVGRVGRKMKNPYGYAYYIASKNTKAMRESIHIIKRMNKDE